MAYEEFKRFKKFELSNFTHLSEMNMQLTQDIDVVKNVVKSLQTQTDEIDEFITAKYTAQQQHLEKLQKQVDDGAIESEKRSKRLTKLEKEHEDLSNEVKMIDSRTDNM